MAHRLSKSDQQEYTETEEKLAEQPTSVLLAVAVELDPDYVAEKYEEGWTREDIMRVIKKHLRTAIGNRGIEGWQGVQDIEVEEISANEED